MVRKSNNNNNKQEQKCQGYYEVSGYTIDDGKKVDSYTRRCWKHSNGGGIVDNPQNVNLKGISDEDEPIFQMPQTKENTLPTDDSIPSDIPNDSGTDNPLDLTSFLNLMFSINTQRNGNGYYTSQPQRYGYNPVNFEYPSYQKFPFSTFDTKTTQEKIKQSNKELEEILKQREISNKDVETMRNSLRNTIGTLCQDIEALSDMKAALPKNPTVESAQMSERIEKEREKTLDNASDAIFLAFNIKKVYDAKFDNADMNSDDYYTRLGNHAKRLDELNAMSESLKTLFDASKEINEGTKSKVQQVRETLNLPKTATQSYTQNATQFQFPTTYPNGYDDLLNLLFNNKTDNNITGFATNIETSTRQINTRQNIQNLNEKILKLSQKRHISAQEIIMVNSEIKDVLQNIFDDFDLYIQKKIYKNETLEQKADVEKTKQNLIKDIQQMRILLDNAKKLFEKYNEEVKLIKDEQNITTEGLQFSKSLQRLGKMDNSMILMYEILVNPIPKPSQGKIFLRNDLQKAKLEFGLKNNVIIDMGVPDNMAVTEEEKAVTPAGTNGIRPVNWKINSRYSKNRIHPIYKKNRPHSGWDQDIPAGKPIIAVADGYIKYAGLASDYGNAIYINHGSINGARVESEYGHLRKIFVKTGQFVQQGEIIGLSGGVPGEYGAGSSSGAHLHTTIREYYNNGGKSHVPPNKYLWF